MADISGSFINHYEAEVHVAYQQGGSRLRNTVRVKGDVTGASTKFTRIGKGVATQKTRNGNISPMNVDHSQVQAVFSDWYGPDYVDKLDEYKINHDERRALTEAGAYAIGRKIDEVIIAAALKDIPSGNVIGAGSAVMTLDDCLEAFALLNEAQVPDDGNRFAVVGPRQWNTLLRIDQFARASYVGENDYVWLRGVEAKRWLGTTWMMHTGLTATGSGATRATKCLMYHKSAIGLGENGRGITSEINYVPEKAAFLCNNMISAGAVAIDPQGIVCLHVKDK
ncbi:phage capsid protein [Desulfovibrio sp. OttesenSCG-928-I05]|nr:phage capsid protein [Desulfovibrio sp. OttesenSCG-928-I05]